MVIEKPAGPGFSGRTAWLSVLAAMLLIVAFAYALANVSMRLQRHITARNQWNLDERRFAADYMGLTGAAAASNALAYDLLFHAAQDDLAALRRDSEAMPSRGIVQRLNLITESRACVAGTAAGLQTKQVASGQVAAKQVGPKHLAREVVAPEQACRNLFGSPDPAGVR